MGENESLSSAPPPPPEVKVRTMQSDLAAMAKSGGGLPRFENVKVESWKPSAPKRAKGFGAGNPSGATPRRPFKLNLTVVLIILAAVAVVALVGFIVYVRFMNGGSPSGTTASVEQPPTSPAAGGAGTTGAAGGQAASPPPAQQAAPSATAPVAAPPPTGPFTHASLFKKPPDQTLTLTLSTGGAAQTAADLLSFNQKLSSVLGGVKKGATLIEINVVGSGGTGVPVSDILAQENADVLDAQFLAAHFNPDATFFVYRDAKGAFWPGYVLSLRAGETWLFLKNDVAKLESSPSIANFFLTDAGAPASSGFADTTIGGAPARILSFPNGTPPAAFVYGWHNADLILSASQGGFEQAVAHL